MVMQLLHEVAWEKILFEVPEDNGAASAVLQGDVFLPRIQKAQKNNCLNSTGMFGSEMPGSGSHGCGYGGQQFVGIDWFGDVFHCALAQAPGTIRFAGFYGNKYDGDMPGRIVKPEFSFGLVAAHAGHDNIHQDQFGMFVGCDLKSLFAGFSGNSIVTAFFDDFLQTVELCW
jgi:hypothetical protein